jgi:hypothetical protein
MDLSILTASLLPLLTPVLPVLVQAGTDIAEATRRTLVDKIGKGAADVACKLWSRISGSASATKAAERVANDPDNTKKQNALEVEIEDLLKADSDFAAELKQLLDVVDPRIVGNVVTASAPGAIAVGGNVRGNITTNVNTDGSDS